MPYCAQAILKCVGGFNVQGDVSPAAEITVRDLLMISPPTRSGAYRIELDLVPNIRQASLAQSTSPTISLEGWQSRGRRFV